MRSGGHHVILYDGVCGLCDRSIRFILPRDRHAAFRFAALGSPAAEALLDRPGVPRPSGETFVVVASPGTATERRLVRGTAALFVLRTLGGAWRVLGHLLAILPRSFLDALYDVVARSRYRIFGRFDACPAPPQGWRERFIDA